MFTIKHLNNVLSEIKGLKRQSVFSNSKNALAYRLSQMNNQQRGSAIEKIIRDILIKNGKKVQYIGGTHPFDMRVNGKRVEIKSAMPRVIKTKKGQTLYYQFQNIKTKNFDKIILVFVTPKGLVTKTVSRTVMVNKLKNNKYYSNGKTYGTIGA